MFIAGALPAFFVLYLRRGLNESEKWKQAVKEQRWNATSDDGAVRHVSRAGKQNHRPFTLKQLFTEREALRRTLLTTVLSIVATTGWWAISSWLPTYTVALAKATGVADAVAWGSRISILYTAGAIVAYLASGFIVDSIGRRAFTAVGVRFAGRREWLLRPSACRLVSPHTCPLHLGSRHWDCAGPNGRSGSN
jgi:MFS family permease